MRKVQSLSGDEPDPDRIAFRLEAELWRYYLERAAVVPEFKEAASREGLGRTSMRNLAELLLRLWAKPRPKRDAGPEERFYSSL